MSPYIKPVNHVVGISLPRHPSDNKNEATCDHKLCGVAHLLLCVDFVIFLTCLQGSLQPVPQLDPGGSCRLDHELEETEQDLFSIKRK